MSNRRAFVTLDGLRGIAALAVVTRHAGVLFSSVSVYVARPGGSVDPVGPFFESYLAVDFFFALSGFVLAHAYGERLRKGMSPTRFMTIRIIRLYPLYLVALLLSIAVTTGNELIRGGITVATLLDIAFALLFLPSPASPFLFPLNLPAWSLFYELLANAALGFIGRHLKTPLVFTISSIAGIILLLSVHLQWLGFGVTAGAMNHGFEWHGLGAGLARVTYSFFVGILIFRTRTFWRPATNVPSLVVVAALSVVLTANPPEQLQAAFDLVTTLVVFPCLIFLGACSTPPRVLARPFMWIGAASYAIYVLQVPIYLFVLGVFIVFGRSLADLSWTWGLGFVAFIFGVAIVADRFVDKPVREFLSASLLRADQKTLSRRSPL
jgi:peptidoglycan/LPS O-acetylase OafA/YrhL